MRLSLRNPRPLAARLLAGAWLALSLPALAQEQPAAEVTAPISETDSATEEAATPTADTIPVVPVTPAAEAPLTVAEPLPPQQQRLDEVMVTATKREKSARDIPVTINAYSGDDLDRRGATNLEEMVKLQPGTSKNGNRVVMRGIATSSLGTYTTSEEVGRFLGDVSLNAPSTRGALADLDTFDMQSIEIAKGPQGTLFGGTALSGAVRFIPNRPEPGVFAGAARVGVGRVAHSDSVQRESALMLNGGIGDSFGIRAVGSWRFRPGAIDDLFSGEKDIESRTQRQLRALALWEPDPALSIEATYLEWAENQDDLGFTSSGEHYETSIRRLDQPSYMDAQLMSLRAQYSWEAASLVGIVSRLRTGWFDIVDLSGPLGVQVLPLVHLPLPVDVSADVPSYELRLVSNAPSASDWWLLRDWDYLFGLFLLKAEQFGQSAIIAGVDLPGPLPPIEAGLDGIGHSDLEERAFFFDLTRGLFERRLEINLGGRLADSVIEGEGESSVRGVVIRRGQQHIEDQRFNPKAALTWRFTREHSIYASAAQGFRYGGSNGGPTAGLEPGIPATFVSDSLWNYEIGLRTEWLDHALRFDITGFRIDWSDLQIQQISTTQQNFVTNVGGALIRGVESLLRWSLPDQLPLLPGGLSLNLGASYIDARITEAFESADGPVTAHTRLPLTPYIQANSSINWNGSLGEWLLSASLSDAYSGPRKNQLVETAELPAYHSVGAVLTLANPNLSYSPVINLSATNLLNEAAQNFGFQATLGPNFVYVLNRPRTLLLSLQLNF